jgi:hypothetical protein
MPDHDRLKEHAILLQAAASRPGLMETLRFYQTMASSIQAYYLAENLTAGMTTKIVGATHLAPIRNDA